MFLVGDHSIGLNTAPNTTTAAVNPYRNKFVSIGTNMTTAPLNGVAWTDSSQHQKQGNIGLADGSVQGFSISALRNAAANTADTSHGVQGQVVAGSNRLGFPGCPDTPSS